MLTALVAVAALAPGAALASGHDATISVGDATVAPGETASVPVVLSRAPGGLSGFDVRLTVTDGSVASVTNATVGSPVDDVANVSVGGDGSVVRVAGVDGTDAVADGDTDVRLATVTVRGETAGETSLAVTAIEGLQSDNGSRLAARAENGTVGVETAATTTVASETTGSSGPGFTVGVAALAAVAASLLATRR